MRKPNIAFLIGIRISPQPLSLDVREYTEDSGNCHSTGSFWIPKISIVENRPTLNHGNMSLHHEGGASFLTPDIRSS